MWSIFNEQQLQCQKVLRILQFSNREGSKPPNSQLTAEHAN